MDETNKYIYTPLPEPIPITEQVWPEGTLPLVYTRTMTYMHKNYIRECIEGILMQKTTFPVRVLIHDDASTDGTADIVREYEQKYPHVIMAYYQKENSYTKPDARERRAEFNSWHVGKYYAICEGDDYWIDEYKLQKQVDFMEANEDFSICFHPVKVYNEEEGMFVNNDTVPDVPEIFDIKTLAAANCINTLSVMYRANKQVALDRKKFPAKLVVGDYLSHMLYAQYGKIRKLPDEMAVYRIHAGGAWSTKDISYTYPIWLNLLKELLLYFEDDPEVYEALRAQYIKCSISLLTYYIIKNDFDSENFLYDQINSQFHQDHFPLFNYLINNLNITTNTFNNTINTLNNTISNLNNEIQSIRNSKSYRLGNMMAMPFRAVRNFIGKISYIYYDLKKDIPYGRYKSNRQKNIDFSEYTPKVKAIAFYLPQFHTIPENDEWWGMGFTEWTNTRKSKPRFKKHYQPRNPHRDIGYYDLTDIETIKKQVRLAKQHGIHGFCFYFYWFSGKRLLEKPLDIILEHPEIDINFCLCWANENWTRRWDGMDSEVLIKQNYSDDDPVKFILDIKKYITDKRYIKIDNVPVILVYKPEDILNTREVFIEWKNYALEIGIGEIKILACKTFINEIENLNDILDGLVEFPPINYTGSKEIYICNNKEVGNLYDYGEFVEKTKDELKSMEKHTVSMPIYHTCMLGWDNAARKRNDFHVFMNFSLESFFEWVSLLVNDAQGTKDKLFFINAWNEWAEGTYLEPDKKYGYANINTLSKAIFGLPFKG